MMVLNPVFFGRNAGGNWINIAKIENSRNSGFEQGVVFGSMHKITLKYSKAECTQSTKGKFEMPHMFVFHLIHYFHLDNFYIFLPFTQRNANHEYQIKCWIADTVTTQTGRLNC
jgi:hypothetical protein